MNWNKITSKGLKREHYQADALIIYCVDNRGKEALEYFLLEKKIQDRDLIIIPGGAKSIAVPQSEAERKIILGYIEKLLALHQAKKIILTTHADCGACGGSTAFNYCKEAEQLAHEQWLVAAKSFLSKRFVVPVEMYFVDYEGFWELT